MDCLEYQELIAAACDGESVDADLLQQAREHCLECPACWAFARTQLTLQGMPLPEPADDLADRAIQAAYAGGTTDAAEAADAADAANAPDADATPVPVGAEKPRVRRAWPSTSAARWLTAAAAVLIVAAVVAVPGVIGLRKDSQRTMSSATLESQKSAPADSAAEDSSAEASSGALSLGAQPEARQLGGPSVITFIGVVHASAGAVTTDAAGLREIGFTTTSLGESSPAERRTVFSAEDPARIYLAGDSSRGEYLAFDRVTRTYGGVTYALVSADVSAFGVWPSLPVSIPTPASIDGGPTFSFAGKDDSGTAVYRLSAADASAGIAIAPGTPSSDPAGANPNWTWWEPVR